MSEADVQESPSKESEAALDGRISEILNRALDDMFPPRAPRNCGNCKYWTPLHMVKTHGQCMLSARSMPAPAITPNLACCTGWEAD